MKFLDRCSLSFSGPWPAGAGRLGQQPLHANSSVAQWPPPVAPGRVLQMQPQTGLTEARPVWKPARPALATARHSHESQATRKRNCQAAACILWSIAGRLSRGN